MPNGRSKFSTRRRPHSFDPLTRGPRHPLRAITTAGAATVLCNPDTYAAAAQRSWGETGRGSRDRQPRAVFSDQGASSPKRLVDPRSPPSPQPPPPQHPVQLRDRQLPAPLEAHSAPKSPAGRGPGLTESKPRALLPFLPLHPHPSLSTPFPPGPLIPLQRPCNPQPTATPRAFKGSIYS